MEFASVSNPGGRPENEDAIWHRSGESMALAMVADGLGGQGGGDRASREAVRALSAGLWGGGPMTRERIENAVAAANQEVLALQRQTGGRMMTTVVLVAIEDETCHIAHVGDSRLYWFRDGQILHQTMDHSAAQMAVLSGDITADQIRHHPDRSGLLRALGGGSKVRVAYTGGLCRPGDDFLLCSDGFWEHVWEAEMHKDLRKARDAKEWLSLLLARVEGRLTAAADNLSAIAVHIDI